MWHRKNWDIVYPHLELDDTELSTLTSLGTYVAGFTDPAIEGRTDLYDLFVNGNLLQPLASELIHAHTFVSTVADGSISIAPHTKGII